MKELPMIEKGMIIIVEKGYKIKSTEFKVKHGALDYGTCEISDDKRYALFKPIVSDKEIVNSASIVIHLNIFPVYCGLSSVEIGLGHTVLSKFLFMLVQYSV